MSVGTTRKCVVCGRVSWYVFDGEDFEQKVDYRPIILCHDCAVNLTDDQLSKIKRDAQKRVDQHKQYELEDEENA